MRQIPFLRQSSFFFFELRVLADNAAGTEITFMNKNLDWTAERELCLSAVAELGLSRTPGRVLSIDVHKLIVQKIHENINGKIDNIQKAPSRSNIFILLQQLIQVLLQQLIQVQR